MILTKLIKPLRLLAIAAVLLVPGLMVQASVDAHHCFGHVGQGEVDIAECADAGACLDTTGAGCPAQASASEKVNSTVRLVVNILSFAVGIASVIMIVIGGFKYVLSAGDSNNIQSAKNTILYAIIGLIIVALAQIIVRFVLKETTDATSTLVTGHIFG